MIKNRNNLTLYHGSVYRVDKPRLGYSRGQKDFGNGFYLTTDRVQAERFAKSLMQRQGMSKGYVNQYFLKTFDGLVVKEFAGADAEWLRFVCACRSGRHNSRPKLDAAIGKIANDNTRQTLDMYLTGAFNAFAASQNTTPEVICIKTLETNKLNNQVCLYTQRALDRLVFIKATVIGGGHNDR